MPLSDWQLSFNGLVIGKGTIYHITSLEGLLDPSDSKLDVFNLIGGHGAKVFTGYYKEKTITIEGNFTVAAANLFTTIDSFRNAFLDQDHDLPLVFKFPGINERRIDCRPTRRAVPPSPEGVAFGYSPWIVELIAQNPAVYDNSSGAKLYDS